MNAFTLNAPVNASNLPLDAEALANIARVAGLSFRLQDRVQARLENLDDDAAGMAQELIEYRAALSDVLNTQGMGGQNYLVPRGNRERAAKFEAGYLASINPKNAGKPVLELGRKSFATLDALWTHLKAESGTTARK